MKAELLAAFERLWWLVVWAARAVNSCLGLELLFRASIALGLGDWSRAQQEQQTVTAASSSSSSAKRRKVPTSIGLLLGNEQVKESEIAAFLLECAALCIQRVVVYDPHGEVATAHDGVTQKVGGATTIDVLSEKAQEGNEEEEEKIRRDTGGNRTRAVLLSPKEGRGAMVRVCRELSSSSSPVTSSSIASKLAVHLLDDVEVVLTVGSTPSLAGFPPWPLRVTELVSCGSEVPTDAVSLQRCLEEYAMRDQRLGK